MRLTRSGVEDRNALTDDLLHSFLEKRAPKFTGNVNKVGTGTSSEYGMPSGYPWWQHVNTADPSGNNWPDVPVKNVDEMEPFLEELRGPKKGKAKL